MTVVKSHHTIGAKRSGGAVVVSGRCVAVLIAVQVVSSVKIRLPSVHGRDSRRRTREIVGNVSKDCDRAVGRHVPILLMARGPVENVAVQAGNVRLVRMFVPSLQSCA